MGNRKPHHHARNPCALSESQCRNALEGNAKLLADQKLECLDWVSYPNGLAKHVNGFVKAWMDENPDIHGIFAGGGVNFVPSRAEWLRIGVGDIDAAHLKEQIWRNILATKRAFVP